VSQERAELHYVLRLYITGSTTRSTRAIENLRRICEHHLPGRYDIEIIDIYADPEAARDGQVIAAPTLVRIEPEPPRRIIGDLADEDRVVLGLELPRA
jgi:circadian clock protein KaiB